MARQQSSHFTWHRGPGQGRAPGGGQSRASCLPRLTAASQHSTCWCYFGACVWWCRRREAGRKDNPCSCSHAAKKNSSVKNSFDIFANKSQTLYFETESQMNIEDSLQTEVLQKLLKNSLQLLYEWKCWLREMAATPRWLGHVTEEILTSVSYSPHLFANIIPLSRFLDPRTIQSTSTAPELTVFCFFYLSAF